MRAADDDVLDAALARQRGEVQSPVELVALDADESEERPPLRTGGEERKVLEIGVDVLVDGKSLAGRTVDLGGGEALQVRDRAIGHEAPAEALDVAVGPVFAWFDEDNAERNLSAHGTSRGRGLPPGSPPHDSRTF